MDARGHIISYQEKLQTVMVKENRIWSLKILKVTATGIVVNSIRQAYVNSKTNFVGNVTKLGIL